MSSTRCAPSTAVAVDVRGVRSRYWHPATDLLVPPPQVRLTLPLTVQLPSQVIVQLPAVHATLEPAPTECVQLLPPQLTLQPGPQVPVHVAPLLHAKLQPLVAAVQVSKLQVWLLGQVQLPPAHTVASHAPSARIAAQHAAATIWV